jgi:hypothetical protein
VSQEAAEEVYGVVLDVDGDEVTVREEATDRRREEIRQHRIKEATLQGGERQ